MTSKFREYHQGYTTLDALTTAILHNPSIQALRVIRLPDSIDIFCYKRARNDYSVGIKIGHGNYNGILDVADASFPSLPRAKEAMRDYKTIFERGERVLITIDDSGQAKIKYHHLKKIKPRRVIDDTFLQVIENQGTKKKRK